MVEPGRGGMCAHVGLFPGGLPNIQMGLSA
jgi:hypothetical protein